MNLGTLRKPLLGLGMSLFAALSVTASIASASMGDVDDPSDELGEAFGQSGGPSISLPPGTRISCSMSSPSGTGRRRASLIVGDDGVTCYREAVPGNIPASSFTPSCHEVGRNIGCGDIVTLTP